MVILNTAEPFNALMLLIVNILLIYLGKEVKNSVAPALALISCLILLIVHAIQLVLALDVDSNKILNALTLDFLFIFISYLGYLWIDDIEAKFKKKKSIDNSLDWLWKKV